MVQGNEIEGLTGFQTISGSALPRVSFRDPSGILFSLNGRIFRFVNERGVADLTAFLGSTVGQKLMAQGLVVRTEGLSDGQMQKLCTSAGVQSAFQASACTLAVEHERVPFPSYPYEWPPEMLHEAGRLTLDLALELLDEAVGLKDATPYNVLFRGPRAVFIDLLSFERRQAGDATWLPHAQFIRTFLLPLLANRHFGWPLDHILMTRRDGLEPEEFYRWISPLRRIKPPFLSLVSLPAWFASWHNPDATAIYQKKILADPEKARFILRSLLGHLRRTLNRLGPKANATSGWSDYMTSNNNYTEEHFKAKEAFVRASFEESRPRRVLDVGCNTGHFSALAARAGSNVVAIDYDPVVVGRVWHQARQENLEILPLVVNLARPSPGIGWRNEECPSFLERAEGAFDLVLMLAVLHHLLVTERVPLTEVLSLASKLTTNRLLIEFVGPEDSMFKRLLRGREELHRGLNPQVFELACNAHFEIVRSQHIEGTNRWLYLLRKRQG